MAVAATETTPTAPPMTRREFLYYLWAASMALFMAETGGAILWFAVPRFREGEFGGVFTLDVGKLPAPGSEPVAYDEGRFWLVNLGDQDVGDSRLPTDYPQTKGIKALYKICVHLGCIYKWVPTNNRFECPCHGSKYLPSGVRVDGPARRNLDAFVVQAVDANGKVLAETKPLEGSLEASATDVPAGTVALKVNTGKRITGTLNSKPGGGR